MQVYRKYIIIFINITIAIWLIKIIFFPKYPTDFFGTFLFMILGLWLLYNIYAFLLYKFFYSNENQLLYLEGLYIFLLILPILLLWYFTS